MYVSICMCVYVSARTRMCTCECVYVSAYVCMRVCLWVYMCTRVY